MAVQFMIALLVELGASSVPGLAMLLALGFTLELSAALAIPVGVAMLSIASILLSHAGLYGAPPLLCAALALPLIAFASRLALSRRPGSAGASAARIGLPAQRFASTGVLMCLIALAVVSFGLLYTGNMVGFDGYIQYDDNATHLAIIETSGRYGYFHALLPASADPFSPFAVSAPGYYPGGYHIVPALAVACAGVNAATAELASATVFCAVAYAAGWYAFARIAFSKKGTVHLCFAPVLFVSAAFPLRMFLVHAPYPNIAGFALIPGFLAAQLLLFQVGSPNLAKRALLSLLTLLTLAFLHPNAAIFGILAFSPYIVCNFIPGLVRARVRPDRQRLAIVAGTCGFTALALASWLILFRLDFMRNVVNFIWDWHNEPIGIVKSILGGSLVLGVPQYAFGAVSLVGLICILLNRGYRWLALSFLLVAVQFFATGIGSDEVKSLFSGFWYTDPERLAAMLAIVMTPLAAFGLSEPVRLLSQRFAPHRPAVRTALGLAACLLFAVWNYAPVQVHRGALVPSAFDLTAQELDGYARKTDWSCYSLAEHDFVGKVREIVPPDALILNFPFDGSTFAYSVDGLNLYYPYRTGAGESKESELIRTGLARYATDHEVARAVRSVGAGYLLILDRSGFTELGESDAMISSCMMYYRSEWEGVNAVGDDTPGFSLVVREGPCSLYRIAL